MAVMMCSHLNDTSFTVNGLVLFGSTRPWDPERCLAQFEKDGVVQTHEKNQRQPNGLSYSHSWASRQKVSRIDRTPPRSSNADLS